MFSTSHLHPMLVHFPIALILIGFLAEVSARIYKKEVCLSSTGFYLLIVGAMSTIVAYLAGEFFTSEMTGAAGKVKELHELFAIITLCTIILNAIFRIILKWKKIENPKLNLLGFLLYAIAAIAVGITGFYGGNLVFNYMMPI